MFAKNQYSVAIETGVTPKRRAKRFGWLAKVLGFLLRALVVAIAAGTPVSVADENYKEAHGLGVYLGVLPAAIVRGHAETHPEGRMHGGAPEGAHQYHLVVAIFDDKTGKRLENAEVMANVSGLGGVGRQNIKLEPMPIAGTITYGNFVELPGNDRYDIKLDITPWLGARYRAGRLHLSAPTVAGPGARGALGLGSIELTHVKAHLD